MAESDDKTIEQAALEAAQHAPDTAGERIAAARARDEAAAEAEESGEGNPDAETKPLEPALADSPEGGASPDAERDKDAPPFSDWPLCPTCNGGGRVPPELRASKEYVACPECGGMGSVVTGSLVPDHSILQCSTCSGNGYVFSHVATSYGQEPETPPEPEPAQEFVRSY